MVFSKHTKGRVQKNLKCKLFSKGGGSTPKFILKKILYTVKRGFKMDFFNTRMHLYTRHNLSYHDLLLEQDQGDLCRSPEVCL